MRRRTLLVVAAIGVAALAITAWSGDSGGSGMGGGMGDGDHGHGSQNQDAPHKVGQFRLAEWTITPDAEQLPSGPQTITALNTGHHTHEPVIVKGTDAAALPTESDGSVDEAALKNGAVGEIEDVAAGSSKHAEFDLTPGTYVAFCNIVDDTGMGMGGGMDHNHFELGMHTTFTVAAA